MKKALLIISFLSIIGITGCSQLTTTHENAIHFEYEDHDYISFRVYDSKTQCVMTGVVHDPNCWCMIDYE